MDWSASPTHGEQGMSVRHGRHFAFEMATIAVPRMLFTEILRPIAEPEPPPDPTRA